MRLLETTEEVVLEPVNPPQAAVVWLHGLGADGHDFVPIVRELGLPSEAAVRFVFPHAPVRPVTLNGGMRMRAWYDIYGLNRGGPQDCGGVETSRARIAARLDALVAEGIAPERIVLAGFSQGGAIALQTALRYPRRLAGLLPLSTYLPCAETLTAATAVAPRTLPVLMMHGQFDPVLPMDLGSSSAAYLQSLGYAVDWRDYPMQHQVCLEQIGDIRAWLQRVLPLPGR